MEEKGFHGTRGHDELSSSNGSKFRIRPKVAIYLLPNLITCMSLFFGLLSIKYAFDARLFQEPQFFMNAAYAILAAGLCDGLDGSIARLTRSQSAFGMQLDSLCDMVSFGVAPAVLVYQFALHHFLRLGFAVAFIYAACGALRLARFNIQSTLGKANGAFTGIPIPMAAAPLAVFILAQGELTSWLPFEHSSWEIFLAQMITSPAFKNISLLLSTFLLALGMISTLEYHSHKSLKLPKKRPFRVFAAVMILCALFLTLQFVVSLAIVLLVYCLHGPVLWLLTRKDRAHEEEEIFDGEE